MASLSKKIAAWLFLGCLVIAGGPVRAADFDDDDGRESDGPPVESAAQKAQKIFGIRMGNRTILSLNECLERALTYNLDLQAADYSIEAARERINEASRIGYPIFDYEYSLAPAPQDVSDALGSFFSGDVTAFNKFKLGIGVPIYTFGKVKTGKNLARQGVVAEQEKKEQKKSEIVLRVKQLYYGILLAREVSHLLRSARNGLSKEVDKREAKEGADPTELLKLKLFRADLEKRMEDGDRKEILAREALRVQLGLDASAPFDVAGGRLLPVNFKLRPFEEFKTEAVANRHDLKALNAGYEAKAKQLALEKRLMAPNLAVGSFFEIGRAKGITGVTTTDDFSNPFNFTRAGVGFQLKGQLDIHTSNSKIRQHRSDLYKLDVQKDLAQDGVELEVKDAYLEVRNTRLDVERAEEAGKLSRQLLFLTQSNYDIGIAEPKDLIEGLQAFLLTRGQYFEAVFNYNSAVSKLQQKIGRIE